MNVAMSIGKVFVPGGMPELTYIPRTERHLESKLAEVEDNLCKLVVVTGATKTGKTVLVRKVLSGDRPLVWIDAGLIADEEDSWQNCLAFLELDLVQNIESASTATFGKKVDGKVSGTLFGVGGSAGGEVSSEDTGARKTKSTPTGSLASKAIRAMAVRDAVLVIDDFHYLDRPLQGRIVRSLKGEIFKGFAAVAIAIPHRRYDAVRVEREMNGRLEPIKVPDWSVGELVEIADKGFPPSRNGDYVGTESYPRE